MHTTDEPTGGTSNTLMDRHAAAKYAGVAAVTLWRWMTKGIRDPFGNRIRLKRQRRGGVLYTCRAWIDEFFAELDKADDAKWVGAPNPGRPEAPSERSARRHAEIARAQANVIERLSA